MSLYFLDSSALVKRYLAEDGSNWIRGLATLRSHHKLIIARLTCVEVVSAFARRQREGNISPNALVRMVRSFQYHLANEYQMVEFNAILADAASQLAIKHPLRAYDAVQLASALSVHSTLRQTKSNRPIFLSADERLIAAAQIEGVRADNPNNHQ